MRSLSIVKKGRLEKGFSLVFGSHNVLDLVLPPEDFSILKALVKGEILDRETILRFISENGLLEFLNYGIIVQIPNQLKEVYCIEDKRFINAFLDYLNEIDKLVTIELAQDWARKNCYECTIFESPIAYMFRPNLYNTEVISNYR